MKPLLTIGALDHISYFLALPFFVQLTTREQQALRTRSKYFRGGPNILKCLDRGVRTFRGSKYFVTGIRNFRTFSTQLKSTVQSIAVPFENSVICVFCVSLRTVHRGGKFEHWSQICQLSQEERQRIQTTCDGALSTRE